MKVIRKENSDKKINIVIQYLYRHVEVYIYLSTTLHIELLHHQQIVLEKAKDKLGSYLIMKERLEERGRFNFDKTEQFFYDYNVDKSEGMRGVINDYQNWIEKVESFLKVSDLNRRFNSLEGEDDKGSYVGIMRYVSELDVAIQMLRTFDTSASETILNKLLALIATYHIKGISDARQAEEVWKQYFRLIHDFSTHAQEWENEWTHLSYKRHLTVDDLF